jgi:lipoprotein-anchoring transpeptidase ErfK/SrfK
LVALAIPVAAPAAGSGPVPPPTPSGAWVARVVAPVPARVNPFLPKVAAFLGTRAKWGRGPVQLLVLDSREVDGAEGRRKLWLKVALPRRPNGSSGWIPADRSQRYYTRWRIEVSTLRRRLVVYRGLRIVRSFGVVVGAPATPTPHGLFAINEMIAQANPRGYLGPWALHLTAFSNVLENFGGGPGRVAIHGRAGASLLDPLGTARSHGCVRIDNRNVTWLARTVPLGTPVRVAF